MNGKLAPTILLWLPLLGLQLAACVTPIVEFDAPAVEQALPGNVSLVTVSGRRGATQRFLVIKPQRVEAAVVLFAGDSGNIGLTATGSFKQLRQNFLLRTRNRFARQGMLVAIVDVPSDRSTLDRFRTSRAHAVDIRAVIRWLRQTAEVPVWLVGTSRGTISAAGVAARLGAQGPDGIVLTSTLFGPSKRGTVFDADLKSIEVPVLLAHHKNDGCAVTPYDQALTFHQRVSATTHYDLITIEGGLGNLGNLCGGMSAHGFVGRELTVIQSIASWITAH